MSVPDTIAAVKGFRDVLPDESRRWRAFEEAAERLFTRYGFGEIRLPVVERTELFARSDGETTETVGKEMYSFADGDETGLTLRPEATAGVVRAYLEGGLAQSDPSARLFYRGPMFRRERPQRGRYRQFYQIGAEVLGRDDPLADAELLVMLDRYLAGVGARATRLELNSVGDRVCRPVYRERLREFGRAHLAGLCPDCHRRLERNPLRMLDCKVESCQEIMARAPVAADSLCEGCRAHLAQVRTLLEQERVAYAMNPRLVRGLDYYCRTAFEVVAGGLGAQNAVGGGGRYDGLVAALGVPDVAGVGFALGLERLAMVAPGGMRRAPPRGRGARGHALRLGARAPRPRRRALHRSPRPQRPRADRLQPRRQPGRARPGRRGAARVRDRGARGGAGPSPGDGQRRAADRRGRGLRARAPGAQHRAADTLPDRRCHRGERAEPAPLPLPRSPPAARAAEPPPAPPGDARRARAPGRGRLRGGGDPRADALHPGGGARLPGAEPGAARQLLRAPAVAAALQAAAHGGRARSLLPDRALLPRRGPARRPGAGVHADRPRDVLRRPRRRDGGGGAHDRGAVHRGARPAHAAPVPGAAARRGDAALRHRPAQPARRPGARRLHRLLRGDRLPRVRGGARRGQSHPRPRPPRRRRAARAPP